MTDTFEDLQQSYGRCLRNKNFIERFYEIFLASNPKIAPMFEKTDFQTQRLALRRGISVAITYAAGGTLVKRTMDQMADLHSRKGRVPVPPSLYTYWVDSLIEAINESDPEITPELTQRWRDGMSKVIDTFTKHY